MYSATPEDQTTIRSGGRIEALDLARGSALAAMAIYHFTWDLEFFDYLPAGTTGFGGWKLFARCIASSFLFLVGVSLFLAHAKAIRWTGFLRRLAFVGGAAFAISAITYFAVPNGFIFFGILHQIALGSLIGLAFLRLPTVATLLIAAAMIATPFYWRSSFFDHPSLWWVGLSEMKFRSNDYVPLFPWFGAVLAGIASAKLAMASGIVTRLASLHFGRWARAPIWGGRHSLRFYLVHQPVLIGCVWLYAQVSPAALESPEVAFRNSCEMTCQQTRDEAFCAGYCACMLDELEKDGRLRKLFAGDESDAFRQSIGETASLCTMKQEDQTFEEPVR